MNKIPIYIFMYFIFYRMQNMLQKKLYKILNQFFLHICESKTTLFNSKRNYNYSSEYCSFENLTI